MEKRYITPVIISALLVVIATILNFIPLIGGDFQRDIIPLIPGNVCVDTIVSFIIPYIFMLTMIFFGPLPTIIFLKLHKVMKLKKYEYFIISTEKQRSGIWILLRSIFPGILAINIALYLSLYGGLNDLFYIGGADPNKLPAVIEYMSVLVGIPVACITVVPIWMLQSSHLMCSKKVELYKRPVSPDIENVGQSYFKMLKGYVGVSTVVSYTLILIQYLTSVSDPSVIMIVFIDPIVIILLFAPLSLLFEFRVDKINARLDNYYEKAGINTTQKVIKITEENSA